jgi:hypothetical protein
MSAHHPARQFTQVTFTRRSGTLGDRKRYTNLRLKEGARLPPVAHTRAEPAAVPEAVLLETKLACPRLRTEHVPRVDLLAVLRSGSRKLTLVAAPPGFGKTTLLAEWAALET